MLQVDVPVGQSQRSVLCVCGLNSHSQQVHPYFVQTAVAGRRGSLGGIVRSPAAAAPAHARVSGSRTLCDARAPAIEHRAFSLPLCVCHSVADRLTSAVLLTSSANGQQLAAGNVKTKGASRVIWCHKLLDELIYRAVKA